MTRLRDLMLAAAMAATTAATAPMVAAPLEAQSVEEILARHYEAVGGVDGWTGLTTMKATGTLNVMSGMMTGPFTIVQKRPAMALRVGAGEARGRVGEERTDGARVASQVQHPL